MLLKVFVGRYFCLVARLTVLNYRVSILVKEYREMEKTDGDICCS